MRDQIRQAAHAYVSVKVMIGRLFLVLVVGVLSLMLSILSWQFAFTAWNKVALNAGGSEVEATLTARQSPPIVLPKGMKEGPLNFSVSWLDPQGRERTAPIQLSSRFIEVLRARQAKTVRIRYLPSDRAVRPIAVEDDGLLSEQLWDFGLVATFTAFGFVLLWAVWRRKPANRPEPADCIEPERPEADISPAEWAALKASPDEALLQRLYARPAACYRIADELGVGPARTIEAFREQIARLRNA